MFGYLHQEKVEDLMTKLPFSYKKIDKSNLIKYIFHHLFILTFFFLMPIRGFVKFDLQKGWMHDPLVRMGFYFTSEMHCLKHVSIYEMMPKCYHKYQETAKSSLKVIVIEVGRGVNEGLA